MFRGTINGVLPLSDDIYKKLEHNGIMKDDWLLDYEEEGMVFNDSIKYNIAKTIIFGIG